jgi:enoyl-CoA hydratase/carnithine racemase
VAEYHGRLGAVGLVCTVTVELVAEDGGTQLLVFATGDSKRLAIFKNELWSADEFAGIRFRDPHDAEHSLVDISLTPQLLPLRRVLLAELARRGHCTVAELQQHTLLETIYRPADTVGALTSAASAGAVTREPEKGRLTPRTVIGHRR